jgi:hypothetical protein
LNYRAADRCILACDHQFLSMHLLDAKHVLIFDALRSSQSPLQHPYDSSYEIPNYTHDSAHMRFIPRLIPRCHLEPLSLATSGRWLNPSAPSVTVRPPVTTQPGSRPFKVVSEWLSAYPSMVVLTMVESDDRFARESWAQHMSEAFGKCSFREYATLRIAFCVWDEFFS